MGCHTWFQRQLTEKEVEEAKIRSLKNIERDRNDPDLDLPQQYFDRCEKAVNENDLEYIAVWSWDFDTTGDIPKTEYLNGKIYADVDEFHDLFRIYTYPEKQVIRNKRQLRRWLRKRYFELITPEVSKELTRFWQKYPGGVITFG